MKFMVPNHLIHVLRLYLPILHQRAPPLFCLFPGYPKLNPTRITNDHLIEFGGQPAVGLLPACDAQEEGQRWGITSSCLVRDVAGREDVHAIEAREREAGILHFVIVLPRVFIIDEEET
jgi:hypothetical protein